MTNPIEDLKAEAKRLRAALAETGQTVTHSQSLELLARQRGHRDWNTLHAAVGNMPPGPPVAVGQTVGGAYLGQEIVGEVVALRALAEGRWRVTLDLAEAVDVVTFDSFSNYRSRITATIKVNGETVERISTGAPQLKLDV